MVKFNEIHLNELISLRTDCDILNTYSFAMLEGSADLVATDVGHSSDYIAKTLDTVGGYCASRNIDHDILFENNVFTLYLY